MNETPRFPFPGAVDADGHILEPPNVWERYIDPQYRDRTIRIRTGPDGLEVLELNGAPARYMRPGQLAMSGAMGKRGKDLEPSPEKTYVNQAPFGSMDPKELAHGSRRVGESAHLSSLGLGWEAEDIDDLELQTACARAYNRWVVVRSLLKGQISPDC